MPELIFYSASKWKLSPAVSYFHIATAAILYFSFSNPTTMYFKATFTAILSAVTICCSAQKLQTAFYPITNSPYLVNKIVKLGNDGTIYYETYDTDFNLNLDMQQRGDREPKHVVMLADAKKSSGELAQTIYLDSIIYVVRKLNDADHKVMKINVSGYDYKGRYAFPESTVLTIANVTRYELSDIHVDVSPEETAFMVQFTGAAEEDLRIFSFDRKWKKIASKNTMIHPAKKEDYYLVDGLGVRDDGMMYYGLEYHSVDGKSEMTKYLLYMVHSASVDSLPFTPEGEDMLSFTIRSDGDSLHIFGLTESNNVSTGLFHGTFDLKSKIISFGSAAFDQKLFITPGEHPEEGAATTNFGPGAYIQSCYKLANGTYDILVETRTWTEKPGVKGSTDLFIDSPNFYIANMTNAGDVNWISTVYRQHKFQAAQTSKSTLEWSGMPFDFYQMNQHEYNFYSSQSTAVGNTLMILGNDDPINSFQPTNEDNVVEVNKSSQLQGVLISIAADGKITKDKMTNTDGDPIVVYPCLSYSGYNGLAVAYLTVKPDECGVCTFAK